MRFRKWRKGGKAERKAERKTEGKYDAKHILQYWSARYSRVGTGICGMIKLGMTAQPGSSGGWPDEIIERKSVRLLIPDH